MPPAGNRNGLCGRRSRPPATEPVRVTGRRGCGRGPVCRLPDWRLLPFVVATLPAPALPAQFGVAEIALRTISLAILPSKVGLTLRGRQHRHNRGVGIADRIHADPTVHRGVTVPSGLVSAQAARCSRPRCGIPGSSTHPDAAPAHSGNDGRVSLPCVADTISQVREWPPGCGLRRVECGLIVLACSKYTWAATGFGRAFGTSSVRLSRRHEATSIAD